MQPICNVNRQRHSSWISALVKSESWCSIYPDISLEWTHLPNSEIEIQVLLFLVIIKNRYVLKCKEDFSVEGDSIITVGLMLQYCFHPQLKVLNIVGSNLFLITFNTLHLTYHTLIGFFLIGNNHETIVQVFFYQIIDSLLIFFNEMIIEIYLSRVKTSVWNGSI